MLNLKNLNKIIKNGASYDNIRKVSGKNTRSRTDMTATTNKEESSSKGDTFFPDVHDSLFWSFYIMKNGQEAYESLGKINIVIERKIKIELPSAIIRVTDIKIIHLAFIWKFPEM